jgi:hypothetical protein
MSVAASNILGLTNLGDATLSNAAEAQAAMFRGQQVAGNARGGRIPLATGGRVGPPKPMPTRKPTSMPTRKPPTMTSRRSGHSGVVTFELVEVRDATDKVTHAARSEVDVAFREIASAVAGGVPEGVLG